MISVRFPILVLTLTIAGAWAMAWEIVPLGTPAQIKPGHAWKYAVQVKDYDSAQTTGSVLVSVSTGDALGRGVRYDLQLDQAADVADFRVEASTGLVQYMRAPSGEFEYVGGIVAAPSAAGLTSTSTPDAPLNVCLVHPAGAVVVDLGTCQVAVPAGTFTCRHKRETRTVVNHRASGNYVLETTTTYVTDFYQRSDTSEKEVVKQLHSATVKTRVVNTAAPSITYPRMNTSKNRTVTYTLLPIPVP